VQQLARSLSADELSRARRFRCPEDQAGFTVGRGVLREILARYLACAPSSLAVVAGEAGKPELLQPATARPRLHFNLSHSHDWALYAVSWGRQVGVDLERVRPLAEADRIAEQWFTARENQVLRSLAGPERLQAFFSGWTRKEACLKATGAGLRGGPECWEVSLAPGQPAQLLAVAGQPAEVDRWRLTSLAPLPGYVAALAVEGAGWELHCWRVTEGP
jgi:4'-phosphopantetheinyl transferase